MQSPCIFAYMYLCIFEDNLFLWSTIWLKLIFRRKKDKNMRADAFEWKAFSSQNPHYRQRTPSIKKNGLLFKLQITARLRCICPIFWIWKPNYTSKKKREVGERRPNDDTYLQFFNVRIINTSIKSKLQHPPPPQANLGHLTTFCARGVGNLTFVLAGWGKLNRKCKVSNEFLGAAEVANSHKHVFGRDRRVKRKRYSI